LFVFALPLLRYAIELLMFALQLLRSAVELLRCALQFLRRATESLRNALPFVWCRVDFPRSTIQSSLDGVQLRRFELQFLRIAARFPPSGGAWGRTHRCSTGRCRRSVVSRAKSEIAVSLAAGQCGDHRSGRARRAKAIFLLPSTQLIAKKGFSRKRQFFLWRVTRKRCLRPTPLGALTTGRLAIGYDSITSPQQ
jgi:hypothetical protein